MSRLQGQLRRILPTDRFARGVAMLAGGAALGQGLLVLASPLLTRLYNPEDFGVLVVYTSILGIMLVVASLRYELAITLPKDDETAVNLLALSLAIVFGMSLLAGIGVWILGDQVLAWTDVPALGSYLWLLPFGLLGSGVYQVFNYWAIRKRAFGRIARTKLSQSLGQVLIQLLLGVGKLSSLGLLLGHLVGQIAGCSTLATPVLQQDRKILRRISVTRISRAASRYRRFPLFSSGSSLLNATSLRLPALMLAAFYGPQVAGLFALTERVVSVPMLLISESVSQVYVGEASRLAREDPHALYRLLLRTGLRLLLIGGGLVGLIALGGRHLFAVVFGEEWSEAGVYIQLLAAMFAARFMVAALSQTLNILERQELQLSWEIGRFALVVGIFASAYYFSWSPRQAIGAYSAGVTFALVVLFVLLTYTLAQTSAHRLNS